MLDRSADHVGLFAPVVVHDCDALPDPIGRAQIADFKDYRLTHMNEAGQTYENFTRAVRQLSEAIAPLIRAAPNFDATWVASCTSRFNSAYQAHLSGIKFMPVHFTPPVNPPHPLPPRLVP
jgi:hypothetical protein